MIVIKIGGLLFSIKIYVIKFMINSFLFYEKAIYCRVGSIGQNWGLRPKIIHWMYTAIVRPILRYGFIVWWDLKSRVYGVFRTGDT